jgi:hypothetical protein
MHVSLEVGSEHISPVQVHLQYHHARRRFLLPNTAFFPLLLLVALIGLPVTLVVFFLLPRPWHRRHHCHPPTTHSFLIARVVWSAWWTMHILGTVVLLNGALLGNQSLHICRAYPGRPLCCKIRVDLFHKLQKKHPMFRKI